MEIEQFNTIYETKINNWRQKKSAKISDYLEHALIYFFPEMLKFKTPILPALLNSFHIWNYSLTISFFVLNKYKGRMCTSIHGPPWFSPATHTHIHEKSSHSQPRAFSTHVFVPPQSDSDFCMCLSLSPQKQSPVLWFHSWNTDQISLIHSECHDTIESHNSLQLKPWSLWKTMWSLLEKTTSRAAIWSSNFTSGFIFRRHKDGVMKRQMHSHVYCSIIIHNMGTN